MEPGEVYDTKRKNFIEKTQKHFEFLKFEYDFEGPNHIFTEQSNGTIILDKFEFKGQNKVIVISNAYHPNDYGFEINLTDLKSGHSEMFHHVLKENQDMEQSYLETAAELLKTELKNCS